MSDSLWLGLSVFALFLWTWGYALCALHWYVQPALRTGVLQARGRAYSRETEPVRFWIGIVAWIALAVVLAFPVLMSGIQLWRRLTA
jgi:hypothetical protein